MKDVPEKALRWLALEIMVVTSRRTTPTEGGEDMTRTATTNWQRVALRGDVVVHMSNRPFGHLHPKPYVNMGRWQA
ncbi:hypothetical protein Lfu02_61380 [Longispora fulva]|nr:hypothetical protein Lfu02_61380 [Longispora fulva]